MELSDQPVENLEQGRGYPQGRFILLLALLAVILIGIAVAQFEGMRVVEPASISEKTLQGDLQAKTAYYYSHSFPLLRANAGQAYTLAADLYERSIREDPSPDVYRRLIILSHESPRKATEHIRKLNPSESAMWRDIYVADKLDRAKTATYERRIRGLHLGWYEHIALSHLYTRAGLNEHAQEQREMAQSEALHTIVYAVVLILVLGALGLVGFGLLIWYAFKKPKGIGSADLPSASDDPFVRSRVSGYLLESFVAYMLAIVVVQVLGGIWLAAAGVELSATGDVIFATTAYVASGLLAVFVLADRIRAAGMTWESIGLRSRRPLADVLSGIGGYAAALPLVLVSLYILYWVSRFIPSHENPIVPLFIESESWVAKLALFLLAVVAAPFFEELFFRGVLFNSLRARWGVAAGVIISAVVFGLVHPLPVGLLPILVLGAVFAVVFRERGSLLPNMVAHACTNAVAFALLFILAG